MKARIPDAAALALRRKRYFDGVRPLTHVARDAPCQRAVEGEAPWAVERDPSSATQLWPWIRQVLHGVGALAWTVSTAAYICPNSIFSRLVLRPSGITQGNRSRMKTLVVFSHLRWDFVFQRPQHLMTRLAPRYKVYFIEEPVHDPGAARLDVNEIAPNLHVCRPHTSIQEPG